MPAALFSWLVNFGKVLLEQRDPSDFTLEDGGFCRGCQREGSCAAQAVPSPINQIERRREPLARTLPVVVVLAAVAALWPRMGKNGATTELISGIQQASEQQQQLAGRMQLLGQMMPFMQM